MIYSGWGILTDTQRILLSTKVLADDVTLLDCEVGHGDCLHLVVCMRGGGGGMLGV